MIKRSLPQRIWHKYLQVKYILFGGKQKYWNYLRGGIKLRPLSKEQKREIKKYWKVRTGKDVDTRWHQLLYSMNGVLNVRYLPFDIYPDIIANWIPSYRVKNFFDDKNLYRYLFKDFNIPTRHVECCNGVYYLPQLDGIEKSLEEVMAYCQNLEDCIIKPSKSSSAGNGIIGFSIKNGATKDGRALKEVLKSYGKNFCIESKLQACDNLRALNPSSCNTLRIHTFRSVKQQKVVFLSAYVRIGREGSVVDNASKGGITCQVMNDGILGDFSCSVKPFKRLDTTDSGIKLKGYKIDRFDEMVSTAIRAHSAIPFFGIIGWDITISNEGKVTIIEYNPDPDMRIEQLPFRDSCLMDCQDEILEEVYGIHVKK